MISKVIAHVLDVSPYGEWNATGWCDHGGHRVCHRSIPYGPKQEFPDVGKLIEDNKEYDLRFVLTTRDQTMSELSRSWRYPSRRLSTLPGDSERARQTLSTLVESDHPHFIWSYETFMFLKGSYLQDLYKFLEVRSDFVPELRDANAAKVRGPRKVMRVLLRLRKFRRLKTHLTRRLAERQSQEAG